MCASHLALLLFFPPQTVCLGMLFPSRITQFHANYDISLHETVTNISTHHSLKFEE